MELFGDMGHVESHLFSLEIVLVSLQDRCTHFAKRTIDLEIILDAPDGTPRWSGWYEPARVNPNLSMREGG